MRIITIVLFILIASPVSFAQAALATNVTSVDFGGIAVGGAPVSPSGPQRDIVMTNTGNAALTISNIQTTGDFVLPLSLFPILPLQLNPGESRDFAITFVATAPGPRSGVLTFTDNAASSPQTVALTGTGLTNDFSLSVQTIPASATVTAGQAAGYILNLASGAQFSGPVTLTCTGLPTGTMFNVVTEGLGTQMSLTSTSLLTFSVQIGTTGATARNRSRLHLWYALGAVLGMTLISFKRQKRSLPIMVLLIMAFAITSCGGSSNSPANGPTPAGTFNVVFTATSGSTVHTAPATLIVH